MNRDKILSLVVSICHFLQSAKGKKVRGILKKPIRAAKKVRRTMKKVDKIRRSKAGQSIEKRLMKKHDKVPWHSEQNK